MHQIQIYYVADIRIYECDRTFLKNLQYQEKTGTRQLVKHLPSSVKLIRKYGIIENIKNRQWRIKKVKNRVATVHIYLKKEIKKKVICRNKTKQKSESIMFWYITHRESTNSANLLKKREERRNESKIGKTKKQKWVHLHETLLPEKMI